MVQEEPAFYAFALRVALAYQDMDFGSVRRLSHKMREVITLCPNVDAQAKIELSIISAMAYVEVRNMHSYVGRMADYRKSAKQGV